MILLRPIVFTQIWKQKLEQMGATTEDHLSKRVTHVFAADSNALLQQVDREQLRHFKKGVSFTFQLSSSFDASDSFVTMVPFFTTSSDFNSKCKKHFFAGL